MNRLLNTPFPYNVLLMMCNLGNSDWTTTGQDVPATVLHLNQTPFCKLLVEPVIISSVPCILRHLNKDFLGSNNTMGCVVFLIAADFMTSFPV